MKKHVLWAVQIQTQRSSHIDYTTVRPLKREAMDTWWKVNVANEADWEWAHERLRSGEIKVVKVLLRPLPKDTETL